MPLTKQSDAGLPSDIPENDGVILFLWRKGHEFVNPSMTWDKLDFQKIGQALQILMEQVLIMDIRNYEIVLKIAHEAKDILLLQSETKPN